jgi:hypothetical protein
MRKVIEVFVNNIRRAVAYPLVLEELDGPSDEEFIECIRRQMRRGPYSAAEIKAARFVVRDLASGRVAEWSDLGSTSLIRAPLPSRVARRQIAEPVV